jgi:hypothetical protein
MKRSLFLQLPLVASALLANAHPSKADRGKKGFKVASGEDRYQEELLIKGGSFDCIARTNGFTSSKENSLRR